MTCLLTAEEMLKIAINVHRNVALSLNSKVSVSILFYFVSILFYFLFLLYSTFYSSYSQLVEMNYTLITSPDMEKVIFLVLPFGKLGSNFGGFLF
jgi:hypothetical protein